MFEWKGINFWYIWLSNNLATKAECPSKTCPNYSTQFSVFPTTQVIYTNTVIESLFVGEILIWEKFLLLWMRLTLVQFLLLNWKFYFFHIILLGKKIRFLLECGLQKLLYAIYLELVMIWNVWGFEISFKILKMTKHKHCNI